MRPHHVALTALCASLAACGESNRAALEALGPACRARRQQWATLAAALPSGAPSMFNRVDSPPLLYDEAHEEGSSAEFVMAEQLLAPDDNLVAESHMDLGLSAGLLRCVRWTGPRSPMSASALRARDGARLRAECAAALARPYLVVLRASRYQPPVATDPQHFAAGFVSFDVLVYDAQRGELRGSFAANAQTDPGVQFTYNAGGTRETVQRRYTRWGVATTRSARYEAPESPTERLRDAALSSLWSNARVAVAEALRAGGASISLR